MISPLPSEHTLPADTDKNQQEMFASIMEFTIALTKKATQQRIINMQVPLSQTSPPSSMKDFRNRYLRDPTSIVSNMACPYIQFPHGHGYVPVCECIANLLSHGRPINAFYSGMKIPSEDMCKDKSVSTTAKCLMLREMLDRAQQKYPNNNILFIPLYGWDDDYDPSASIKGGRVSCDCKYVAVAPPYTKHNSLDNTFTLVLSRKKVTKKWRHYSLMKFYHCKIMMLAISFTGRTLRKI
jgi:hypothetical protein